MPRVGRRVAWIAAAAIVILFDPRACRAGAQEPDPPGAPAPGIRLAGVLALDAASIDRWPRCDLWIYPVGDPYAFGRPDGDEPGYVVNRGIERRANGTESHQGVDLCNRAAGGSVRAAALGLVVVASTGDGNGYGVHAVVAHRLEDGALAYTVYAHLATGSLGVRPGQVVQPGHVVGRVGRTGRASTDHLHFEVRLAADPERRWERTRPIDPLEFIAGRLPDLRTAAPGP